MRRLMDYRSNCVGDFVMRKVVTISLILVVPLAANAQDSSQTLAATMDVFVFPAEGQNSSKQSK